MRTIGFVVLIAGFAWICWDAWSMRPIAHAVLADHSNKLPRMGRMLFKPEDVDDKMRAVVSDTVDHLPLIVIPAGMMLLGGTILGFAGGARTTQTQ